MDSKMVMLEHLESQSFSVFPRKRSIGICTSITGLTKVTTIMYNPVIGHYSISLFLSMIVYDGDCRPHIRSWCTWEE